MVINIILSVITAVLFGKIIFDFYYLYVSKTEMKKNDKTQDYKGNEIKILIVIPVLREQNVIEKTLEHFKTLKVSGMKLTVCIAGTIREKNENAEFNKSELTCDIVRAWIEKYEKEPVADLRYHYAEANDNDGDRASQLNYAVEKVCKFWVPDLIGVYDADSLPDNGTLIEVMNHFAANGSIACQQPVHFIDAANGMAALKANPILVANALYQTTWTMIRELPRWSSYHSFCAKKGRSQYGRNVYLIGHGEFVSYEIYRKFKFPENEVTDGIQLGYRLAMCGQDIALLHTFCSDDVPRSVTQLIRQHKRWFGGCMRLMQAYRWSLKNNGAAAFWQVIDGYWSQASWAYASVVSLTGIALGIISAIKGNWTLPLTLAGLLIIYCYAIPYIAHKLLPVPVKVRLIDWLCLPLAIALKGIGPNLYFFDSLISKMIKKTVKYSKVER